MSKQKTNKYKPAPNHTSKVLDALLNEITPQEQKRNDKKLLALKKLDKPRN